MRTLSVAERGGLEALFGNRHSDDLRRFARDEADFTRRTLMHVEAGKRDIIRGNTPEGRKMLSWALDGELVQEDEVALRRELHRFFVNVARDAKGRSQGLEIDAIEVAAELITPIDREAAVRLMQTAANLHAVRRCHEEAGRHYQIIAYLLKRDEPERAKEAARAAVSEYREAAKTSNERKMELMEAKAQDLVQTYGLGGN